MDVDIVEFVVPVENNKTVLVWNIEPLTEAEINDRLFAVFSSFGPLYLLKLTPNAWPRPHGFSALIKFYSGVQAAEAQRETDGRSFFNSQLKVRLSSKQTPHFLCNSNKPLSHSHCLELANHCLGFNGWTSDIITLKELTDEGDVRGEEGGVSERRLRFGCVLQLSFPHHGKTTRGGAVVEDTCTDTVLQSRSKLLKRVRDRALVQAFSNVLLILLGNGKVMVEVKQTSEQFVPEQTEGVVQVNHFDPDEEPLLNSRGRH
ncbi:RAD52 motif-containing protein 1 isoform X2 [Solea solea]|uniref:RAD52 motif-containing protein 1 isoform X2 n=1 Tax=Solea solea TaxID=90069 RepID=UPI00272D6022|nr:RAD52 motif-containing protein 1 isoform X2 [Solea solea]